MSPTDMYHRLSKLGATHPGYDISREDLDPSSYEPTIRLKSPGKLNPTGMALSPVLPGIIGTGIGGLVGALREKDEDEDRGDAILRSALTGGATGAGVGLGGALGAAPGILAGDLGVSGLGALGGSGAGGILAYLLSRRK